MAVAILKRTMPSTTKQSTTKQRRLRMWRHVQNGYYCGAYQKDLSCTIQSCDHLESQIPLSRAKSFDSGYYHCHRNAKAHSNAKCDIGTLPPKLSPLELLF